MYNQHPILSRLKLLFSPGHLFSVCLISVFKRDSQFLLSPKLAIIKYVFS